MKERARQWSPDILTIIRSVKHSVSHSATHSATHPVTVLVDDEGACAAVVTRHPPDRPRRQQNLQESPDVSRALQRQVRRRHVLLQRCGHVIHLTSLLCTNTLVYNTDKFLCAL